MKTLLNLRTLSLLLALALAALPSASFAQDDSDTTTSDGGLGAISLTTSTTSLVALPVTTTVGIVVLTSSLGNSGTRTAPKGRQRRAIQMYLNGNKDGVIDAQAVGAGSAVTDLAALFGVPAGHEKAMGRAMRVENKQLAAILTTSCDTAQSCDALADQWIDVAFASLDRTLQ